MRLIGAPWTVTNSQFTIHIKAQNSLDMAEVRGAQLSGDPIDDNILFRMSISIYDESRSLMVQVGKVKCPEQHAALVAAIKAHGQAGRLNPIGHKVYLYARRVGRALCITVSGRLPGQQQPW